MRNKQAIRRIWVLVLAVTMLFAIAAPSVAAVGTGEITFGQICCRPGERVIVPVTVENNPGLAGFRFRIAFDAEMLKYVSIEKGDILAEGTLSTAYQAEKEELTITWFHVKNATGDGVLFYLTFDVSKEASGVYPLEVSYLPEDLVNATWQQVDCKLEAGAVGIGNEILGSVTSYGPSDGEVTLQLKKNGQIIASTTATEGAYQLPLVLPGQYQLEVSKQNHVTRTYELTVTDEDLVADVKIHLRGDLTGDGKANVADVARVYVHVRKTKVHTDAYMLACSEISGDGRVSIADVSKLYAYVRGFGKLY